MQQTHQQTHESISTSQFHQLRNKMEKELKDTHEQHMVAGKDENKENKSINKKDNKEYDYVEMQEDEEELEFS